MRNQVGLLLEKKGMSTKQTAIIFERLGIFNTVFSKIILFMYSIIIRNIKNISNFMPFDL